MRSIVKALTPRRKVERFFQLFDAVDGSELVAKATPVVDFVMRTITLEVQLSESSIPMVDE